MGDATIVLRADEALIASAKSRARREQTTLDAEIHRWLIAYGQEEVYGQEEAVRRQGSRKFDELMRRLSYVSAGGRRFSRDEMNER